MYFGIVTFFLYPPPLPPAQITTNDQFRSYSENIFCYILQVRDELCLAHEAFQFFRKFNLKPLITKKFIRQIFPDRNTDLVMEGPIHHQPSSTNERRRLKTDIYCKHHTTFNSVMCRHRCQSTFWRGHVKKFLRYIWLLYPCLKCTTLWPAHLLPLLGCSCSHCSISTIPHICHRHHRRCLCKNFLSGVNFSRLNAKNCIFYTFWGCLL